MPIARSHGAVLGSVLMNGANDRWDLWKSPELIGANDSWVGVVKRRPDGKFVGRPGASRLMLGPFESLEEASCVIGEISEDH